jgi:parallel beta-helix repeat protein
LLDFLGIRWSILFSQRGEEVGVAFAFPPVALSAFWKAGRRADTLHSRVKVFGWRNEEGSPVSAFCQLHPATELLSPCDSSEQTITNKRSKKSMNNRIVTSLCVLCGILFAVPAGFPQGSLTPPGPPTPTMKSLDQLAPRIPITNLPFTISQPGSYYLTTNLTGVAGQDGIYVAAAYVTIDLNGFTLAGVPGSYNGINGAISFLTVRRGFVQSWGQSGIEAGTCKLDDVTSSHNGYYGFLVGLDSILTKCLATFNSLDGFALNDGSEMTGCTAGQNTGSGINLLGRGCNVSQCTMRQNSGAGIVSASTAHGCTISTCTARGNNLGGIDLVGQYNSIIGCTASGNSGNGIVAAYGSLILNNNASGNTDDGIHTTGSNSRIDSNHTISNAGLGINSTGGINGDYIMRNSSFGNATNYYPTGGSYFGPLESPATSTHPTANY